MKRLAVCVPTRGTLFTRVINAIETEIAFSECSVSLFIEEGIQTPQVFNELIYTASKITPNYILFVEEDTVPPLGSLRSLLSAMEDPQVGSACVQYPVQGDHSTVVHLRGSSEILYCGMGCTLIRYDVFKKMDDPWFRSDFAFQLSPDQEWKRVNPDKQYGLYDILFFTRMRKMGYRITQVPGECEHLQIVQSSTPSLNGSTHIITNKATECHRSELSVDPALFWSESYL